MRLACLGLFFSCASKQPAAVVWPFLECGAFPPLWFVCFSKAEKPSGGKVPHSKKGRTQKYETTAAGCLEPTPVSRRTAMGLDRLLNDAGRRRALSPVRLSLLGLALLLPACQERRYDAVPLYSVRGKVLFNGQPAAGAEVRFHPVNPSEKVLSPAARVEADGSFALTTYE